MADVTASGAGTGAVNGTYVETGTHAGKPYYYFAASDIYLYWSSFNNWSFQETAINELGNSVYISFDSVATPDLVTTWDLGDTGANPVPTVVAGGGATAPTVTTSAVSSIGSTTATGNGNVTSDGGATITERGVCWKTSSGPTTSDSKATSAGTTGVYAPSMTGLLPGVTYYVKAYAINSAGTSYGSEVSFTTNTTSPTVTTQAVSSIGGTTATGNGNVTSDGGATITERGVCWKTSSGPTTSDSKATSAGTTGAYSPTMSGLSPGTTYFVRAYAINSVGTSYGSEVSFTTLDSPTVTTQAVLNIETNSATGNGNVTLDGGGVITERGTVRNTTGTPTTSDIKSIAATGNTGAYTTSMSGLNSNVTYYVRAYAINSVGTSYGSEVNFTTTGKPLRRKNMFFGAI